MLLYFCDQPDGGNTLSVTVVFGLSML